MVKGHIASTSIIGAVALGLCVLMLNLVNPTLIGPIGVTAWFLMLLVGLTALTSLVAYVVASRLSPKSSASTKNAWRRGLFVGGYLTVMLGLSSLQQLNLRDAVLLALLFVLIEFYMVLKK